MIAGIYKTYDPFAVFFCFPSAPMHVVARIPQNGYVRGQTIDVDVDVDNRSGCDCTFRVEFAKVSVE